MAELKTKHSIRKILIANRGEIAMRVMRTCRDLGIRTVVVYSKTDETSPHALYADEAVYLDGESAAETYLNQDRILEIAQEQQVDAIHPGYGFLSENAGFAEKCADRKVHFIGPDAHAIREMGDKTRARELMESIGVPIPPGTRTALESDKEAEKVAHEIGYPVLVKAAAGGGGKGMRKVDRPEDLVAALKAARSESTTAFGDDRIYIEKYLEEPRHIEFQILADKHGNVVHLFDRECSIQRRHQKVIEESPSPFLDDDLRDEMGKAAVRVAQSCGYVGAGTVEFLVDKTRRFFFLEMNTRLQVEHPVTEMITGLDLVALQIMVAEGGELPWQQAELKMTGHAIECRICAENPLENFLPATGTLQRYSAPSGPRIRMDDGIRSGQRITAEYDPLLAKLVVHGTNREEAISRMCRALDDTAITGVPTTIPFCRFVMEHPLFTEGRYDTHFIANHFSPESLVAGSPAHPVAIIAGLLQLSTSGKIGSGSIDGGNSMPGIFDTGIPAPSGNVDSSPDAESDWWRNRKKN